MYIFLRVYWRKLTEPSVFLIQFSLLSLLNTVSKHPVEEDVEVTEDDERRRKDRTVVKGHDQLISLELPHLVRNRLDFEEGVAVEQVKRQISLNFLQYSRCKTLVNRICIYLKTAMSRLTRRMLATRR